MNLHEFCKDYLKLYKEPFIKPSTYERYQTALKLIPRDLKLETLTAFQLQNVISSLHRRGYSGTSIKHVKILIDQSIRKARQLGTYVGADFTYVEMPKKKRKKNIRAFSAEEQQNLLFYAKNSFYYNLISFLLFSGCRVGEAIALEWSDVDLKSGYFTVQHTDYHGQLQTPKTDESTRKLPISPEIRRILIDQYRFTSGRVFLNTLGCPVAYRSFLDVWHRVLERGNISSCGVHILRHTYATNALRAGVDVKVLSKLLGHASVAITLDIYCDVIDSDKLTAAEKISCYLSRLL